ncbi:MAG: 50S ribosomal protein L11 methyltransferase [Zetaproteobacteria bacterium]|nr:MAG: 50S ribosomal protein L11 methyltransferase [Zetaproteobacteria bacterium]
MDEDGFGRLAGGLRAVGVAEECDPEGRVRRRCAWFPAAPGVRERLIAAIALCNLPPSAVRIRWLDESWATAWRKQWHGQRIGRRLWVRPDFRPKAAAGMVDIVLTPGMAFGTGTHATTRLMLTAIERVCAEGTVRRMLDMGTGSGILAIAAARLGVGAVVAIDCDADAVAACRENARINKVRIEVRLGDAPPERERFDLVVANILAAPLIAMAEALSCCVGGRLLLSGVLARQAARVEAAYAACGLQPLGVETEEEWALLEFVRADVEWNRTATVQGE